MTKKRKEEVLENLLSWIADHDIDFVKCAVDAMGLTNEEIDELDLDVSNDEESWD